MLSNRGLDPQVATKEKVTLLVGNLTENDFGLEPVILSEMRKTVTHIFHIAWNVNWNLPLSAFEPLIQGLRNLINFALSSELPVPPRLIYPSTISVFRNIKSGLTGPERSIEDLGLSIGQGYSESKLVAEKILEHAMANSPLKAVIVRLGQISGNKDGSWNVSDWFPAMLKSSLALGCLPEVKGLASFTPADVAAHALNEMRDSDATIMHISHPRPVSLSELLAPISQKLNLSLVPYDKWLASLEQLEGHANVTDIDEIPALKILPFFKHRPTEDLPSHAEAFGLPTLSTEVAVGFSKTLNSAPPLVRDDALRWLAYWQGVGYI